MRQATAESVRKQRFLHAKRQETSWLAGEAGDRHAPVPSDKTSREPDGRPVGERGTTICAAQPKCAPAATKRLSVRAQNVLNELAPELTGEQPPKGSWLPSRDLLRALTAQRLATARNCGPRTSREIVDWAKGYGVTIKPVIQPGGSLSQMWGELIANASAGALTSAEIVGALERSIRRKSVRIPIAFQLVLVEILMSSVE